MDWKLRFVVSIVVLVILPQILDSLSSMSFDTDEDQPPLPLPTDRVRRPLPAASPDDPLSTVEDAPIGAGEFAYGTSFPVAPGTWLTARHVANQSCSKVLMLIAGERVPASIAYVHPDSDLTLLKTPAVNAPALAIETADTLDETDTGYTFGFPGGKLGATQDELLGRARLSVTGVTHGTGPSLTWAEIQRFPDSLKSLGGMSGGPMLDRDGKIVGIMVAASLRRGRIDTVAPEVLLATEAAYVPSAAAAAPASEVAGHDVSLGDAAQAFSRNNQIAKTYCLPLGVSLDDVPGLSGQR